MNPRLAAGGAAAAGLLVAAVAAFLVVRDDGDGSQSVATDATTSSTLEETTTTTAQPPSTTTTAVPTTVASTTSTTRRTTTTTAKAQAQATFSISPTSGPANTYVTARGGGCDDPGAGVAITLFNPQGQAYNGTGASTQPDGTWEIPFHVSNDGGPGRYRIEATCQGGNKLRYAPQYFTMTA